MNNPNATEAPIQGQTVTVEFLFVYHRGDVATTVGVSEAEITKLFERPTHRIKTRTTKTNERPGGPLQGYDGPLNSNAFLLWAIQHARTRIVETLFAQSHNELIRIAKEEYGLSAADAWTLLRSVERVLSKYGRALDSGAFIEWAREITFGTHLQVRCFKYRNAVRRCLQHKLDPARYESNKGLTDTFQNRSTYAQNDLKITLGSLIDDLEAEVWRACAGDTKALIGLSDTALHDAIVKRAFRVADSWRDSAIKERKVSGGQNVEDLTGWTAVGDDSRHDKSCDLGMNEPSAWEPNSEGIHPTKAPFHPKMGDRAVIGYRIINGRPKGALCYGNPRSQHFLPAVGKKQKPLDSVETDEWVTAVMQSGPMKLADLKRKAKVEKNWGKDRITAAVKRLGLIKEGLYVRLPESLNVRAA